MSLSVFQVGNELLHALIVRALPVYFTTVLALPEFIMPGTYPGWHMGGGLFLADYFYAAIAAHAARK